MSTHPTFSRRTLFEQSLRLGTVELWVISPYPRLSLPREARGEPQVMITLAKTRVASDLSWDSDGITATIRVEGIPCPCYLPWGSVRSMSLEGSDHIINWAVIAPPAGKMRAAVQENTTIH